MGFPAGSSGKESTCTCRSCRIHPWVRKIPWRRKWQSILVFLLRSMVGYSPRGSKQLDATENTSMWDFMLIWQGACSSVHGDYPGNNTGVGSLYLLQQVFPTQELNQGLLHCRRILYQLSYQGSPLVPLLLHHFSRGRLCVTPEMAAHQSPPSLGFSMQEHWSGLPFFYPWLKRPWCSSFQHPFLSGGHFTLGVLSSSFASVTVWMLRTSVCLSWAQVSISDCLGDKFLSFLQGHLQ